TLGRLEATVMLLVFVGWLTQSVLAARRVRDSVVMDLQERTHRATVLSVVGGLALLVLSGRLIVTGAIGVSEALGWDGFVVGALFVAIGTSAPEIATMLAARAHGHDDIGVGTVLGSNIFNTLLIVGVAALISPVEIARTEILVGTGASMLVILLALPNRSGHLRRWRSAPLLLTYVALVSVMIGTSQA
ncbi:MAG: hypothetical protein WB473_11145, partial [Pedococcus sp.]